MNKPRSQSYREVIKAQASHLKDIEDVAKAHNVMLKAINKACGIIEVGDQRLLAVDGPVDGLPALTIDEWRELYVTLDRARRER